MTSVPGVVEVPVTQSDHYTSYTGTEMNSIPPKYAQVLCPNTNVLSQC